MYYKQCKLNKDNITTISWIPEEFAKLGKVLKIMKDGEWNNGWVVDFVCESRVEEKYLLENLSRNYTRTRKASDI